MCVRVSGFVSIFFKFSDDYSAILDNIILILFVLIRICHFWSFCSQAVDQEMEIHTYFCLYILERFGNFNFEFMV